MAVQYAKSYVDRVCDSRDVFTLYGIVRTLDAARNLPEPFKLLIRMWEWCCSTRSGVWQYYENVSMAEFNETAKLMDQFGLGHLAAKYRGGMKNWEAPDYCGDLDVWIDNNWSVMEEAAMSLVDERREFLYPTRK